MREDEAEAIAGEYEFIDEDVRELFFQAVARVTNCERQAIHKQIRETVDRLCYTIGRFPRPDKDIVDVEEFLNELDRIFSSDSKMEETTMDKRLIPASQETTTSSA